MKYLYLYNYIPEYKDLAKLELESIFNDDLLNDNYLISNKDIEIDLSPFIKYKFKLIDSDTDFNNIVSRYDDNETSDFLIKYVNMYKEEKISRAKETKLCMELGLKFINEVNFKNPTTLFGITKVNNIYYFGYLEINDKLFKLRNNKPISYSNSLDIIISKSSLNIITKGNKEVSIVDPCCGVGTVVIEGLAQNYNIEGYDINFKVVNNANENLKYFGLKDNVKCSDIRDIKNNYDCSIIDIPYGLFSLTTEEDSINILKNAKRISNNILIVSSSNISNLIEEAGLKVINYVTVNKKINREFKRYIFILK